MRFHISLRAGLETERLAKCPRWFEQKLTLALERFNLRLSPYIRSHLVRQHVKRLAAVANSMSQLGKLKAHSHLN